jgi:Cys-tRNA(Pro)/Cys-tRNA(Cys) deacylase
MAGKTNVIRIVESLGITYETALYEAGEEHHDAVAVARRIGVEPEIVFKTLVARSEKGEIAIFLRNCSRSPATHGGDAQRWE